MAYVPDEAVYESRSISHAAFKLFVCYCAHRNSKSGLAWPDRDTVNKATGINANYISTLKGELAEAKWIAFDGKKIRPLKGFANSAEISNDSISCDANKEDTEELLKNSASVTEISNDSSFHESKISNDSREISNSSNGISNDSSLHIKEYEPVEEPVEEPKRERGAPSLLDAVPGSVRQVEIFERYYPGLSDQLSIYQREVLGTMQDLADCEAAIRYAAGNGFRPRSVDKIVNQVYENREWEKGKNGNAINNGNYTKETASTRNAKQFIRNVDLLARRREPG